MVGFLVRAHWEDCDHFTWTTIESPFSYYWSSSNPATADPGNSGLVLCGLPGSATITADALVDIQIPVPDGPPLIDGEQPYRCDFAQIPVQASAGITVTGCGDERDQIKHEYVLFGVNLSPACADFTQSRHSVFFSFNEINTGDFSWALVRSPLIAAAASGYGLDAWRTAYGGPRIINSAYRNPVHNAAIGGAPQSRHMFGDAADLRNVSMTTIEWQAMVDAAVIAHPDFIEPLSGPCQLACVHADWRGHAGGYQ